MKTHWKHLDTPRTPNNLHGHRAAYFRPSTKPSVTPSAATAPSASKAVLEKRISFVDTTAFVGFKLLFSWAPHLTLSRSYGRHRNTYVIVRSIYIYIYDIAWHTTLLEGWLPGTHSNGPLVHPSLPSAPNKWDNSSPQRWRDLYQTLRPENASTL